MNYRKYHECKGLQEDLEFRLMPWKPDELLFNHEKSVCIHVFAYTHVCVPVCFIGLVYSFICILIFCRSRS